MIAYRQNYVALQHQPRPKRKRVQARRDPRPALSRPAGTAMSAEDLLARISAALSIAGIGSAEFGRRVNRDPSLLTNLYEGRRIREGTRQRIIAVLEQIERGPANG